jgi:hypothetical protein
MNSQSFDISTYQQYIIDIGFLSYILSVIVTGVLIVELYYYIKYRNSHTVTTTTNSNCVFNDDNNTNTSLPDTIENDQHQRENYANKVDIDIINQTLYNINNNMGYVIGLCNNNIFQLSYLDNSFNDLLKQFNELRNKNNDYEKKIQALQDQLTNKIDELNTNKNSSQATETNNIIRNESRNELKPEYLKKVEDDLISILKNEKQDTNDEDDDWEEWQKSKTSITYFIDEKTNYVYNQYGALIGKKVAKGNLFDLILHDQ